MPLHGQSQRRGQGRWPVPLSYRIDRWLWASSLSSIGMMTHLMNIHHDGGDSGPFGIAIFMVILFYNITLLILSTKERKIAAVHIAGQRGLEAGIGIEENAKAIDVEEGDDVFTAAHLRQAVNFWILAVCQSGVAALALYMAGRLALLLRSSMHALQGPLASYVDLVFSATQMGVLGYIGVCCIVCQLDIATYNDVIIV
ncbi:hypothetical protein CPB84DRAFT_1962381 [Gymnopilus junonius]|uniref:Uncharacterized protein n=1 Tax=Gymnopilus junonius TaxID=109634 RepID=A0A9P5NKM0_GYMJU|nr:hypothetical protein CPB84DRAFT_1962381 [Gymnopilus junonius]